MRRLTWPLFSLPVLMFVALLSIGDAPKAAGPIAFRGARLLTAEGPAHRQRRADRPQGQDRRGRAGRRRDHSQGRHSRSTSPARRSSPAWWIRIRTSASGPGRTCRPTATATRGSGPVQSGLRAIDAIHPDDPGIRMAVPAASPRPTSCPAAATSSAARPSTSSCAAGPSRQCASRPATSSAA